MIFSIYLPPQAKKQQVPLLFWLSGLTCTDENFVQKAGAHRYASEHGVAIVAPDTSPRGANLRGEDDDWDFGTGAGFYLTATQDPWSKYYNMYEYIVSELPELIYANFPVDSKRQSIFGHSMGGHGALTIALKNPGQYRSVSAFAPIVAPTQCPWGEKAFLNYLGNDRSTWEQYDASILVKQAKERLPILIDQGDADDFLKNQLKTDIFQHACKEAGYPVTIRRQPGYDHSYFFINSFMGEHIAHHMKALQD